MFDIGFSELLLTAVIALLVIGPKRLPETIRTIGLWVGRTKRALNNAYREIDRELGLDDIRRQLHNEEVMRSLEEHKKRLEAEILGRDKAPPSAGSAEPDAGPNAQESSATTAAALSPEITAKKAAAPEDGSPGDIQPDKDTRHE